jgi:F0F1-type ATP synthase membrane subunit c/vacuolar-type H+-ATPase subunit K
MDDSKRDPGVARTSTLAVVALVLSLSCVGFLPGIVCGHIALHHIRRDPTLSGKGMAVAAVTVGYVVFGLLVLLLLTNPSGEIQIKRL